MLHPIDFFDLSDPLAASLFESYEMVWSVIPDIKHHIKQLVGDTQTILGNVMDGAYIGTAPIYIGEGATIEPGAYIQGPAYIAAGAIVRHGAYVRDNVIMLPNSILGHASEAKNTILMHNAHAPHFNYVGDAILGNNVNLGAGTKLSNLGMLSAKDEATGKRPTIKISIDDMLYDTDLSKLGGILGDNTQTGCNSVLNPGCLVGRNTLIYANASLRKGYYPPDSIVKLRQTVLTICKN